jgi:hypothetical protein
MDPFHLCGHPPVRSGDMVLGERIPAGDGAFGEHHDIRWRLLRVQDEVLPSLESGVIFLNQRSDSGEE